MSDTDKEIMESFGDEAQEASSPESKEAPEASSAPSSQESPPEKTLQFTYGDKTYEIPAAAKYKEVSKEGKELEIELADLARSGWAQSDISRKYTELDNQRKQLEKWGELQERLANKGDEKGYGKVTRIINELVKINPELANDLQEFEQEYAKQLVEYLQTPEEERDVLDVKYKAKTLEKENQELKAYQFQDLKNYTVNQAESIIEEYRAFGATLQDVDGLAAQLVRDGVVPPASDRRSVDTVLREVKRAFDEHFGPKKEQAVQGLNAALDLVSEISPELAKSDEAVLDAYNLLTQKKLPREKALKKLQAMYEDTLPNERSEIEKQRERITGRKEPSKKVVQPKVRDRDMLIDDPEAAFRQGLY